LAEEATKAAEEAACQKGNGNEGVLDPEVSQHSEDYQKHHKHYGDHAVLPVQISVCTIADVPGDFYHLFGTFGRSHDLPVEEVGKAQSQQCGNGRNCPTPGCLEELGGFGIIGCGCGGNAAECQHYEQDDSVENHHCLELLQHLDPNVKTTQTESHSLAESSWFSSVFCEDSQRALTHRHQKIVGTDMAGW
jgi:hypothetical protein